MLGVVNFSHDQSIVIADIPGLIEGAHRDVGLGHDFLRHVERTKVLIFLIDAAALGGGDPVRDFKTLKEELQLYNPLLAEKPFVVALNKIDIPEAQEHIRKFIKTAKVKKDILFPISAATGEGVKALMDKVREFFYS